jgi:hypothetical protein
MFATMPAPGTTSFSCSIVGEVIGVRGVVRKFRSHEEILQSLNRCRISTDRYKAAAALASGGRTVSFDIDLNEAQLLSVIQTDTTE